MLKSQLGEDINPLLLAKNFINNFVVLTINLLNNEILYIIIDKKN